MTTEAAGLTCPSECMFANHPGREHEEWVAQLEADGEAQPAMCACGHGLHLHDPEGSPYLCLVCGDNARCDYADPKEIAADRWDEGWHAAVISLCPIQAPDERRLLWALNHMPSGNPYREEEEA